MVTVAQLAEHFAVAEEVAGSSPVGHPIESEECFLGFSIMVELYMMWQILTKRISTSAGIITLLLVVSFVGWLMIREYKKFVETRFETIEIKVFGEK